AQRGLDLRRIVERGENEAVLSLAKPFLRQLDGLLVPRGLRYERAFPVPSPVVQPRMKVKVPAVSIEIQLEERKPGCLVEHGDRQAINAARRLLKIKENREGMLAPARHAIRRARLKTPPVLGVFALANVVEGVLLRVRVINSLAAKFVGRIIKSADSPDQSFGGPSGTAPHGEHRQDKNDHPKCCAWLHSRSPLGLARDHAGPPWIFNP